MNVVIAVFPERLGAEKAYERLAEAQLNSENIALIGPGYGTLQEFGVTDQLALTWERIRGMAFWLIPFGFVGGFAFNLQTALTIVPGLNPLGNHILGGIFGAIAGAMGSVMSGGGLALTDSDRPRSSFNQLLNQGKYLVAAKGSLSLHREAKMLLKAANPESLETFYEPS